MTISARRYCDRAFPPYRYVPGEFPHPTAHPDGHSYQPPGSPPHRAPPCEPANWQNCEAYLHGCDLYNHAYWWEAHEAWEALWQVTDKAGVQGRFLQGLIQVSACHLKIHTGHRGGVERLSDSSLGYLRFASKAIPDARFMGLDLDAFIARVDTYFHAVLAGPAMARHDLSRYPYISLEITD